MLMDPDMLLPTSLSLWVYGYDKLRDQVNYILKVREYKTAGAIAFARLSTEEILSTWFNHWYAPRTFHCRHIAKMYIQCMGVCTALFCYTIYLHDELNYQNNT